MNFVLKLCLLFLIILSPVFADPGEVSGVVTYVLDGDTIEVSDFGLVRFADIDCPEITGSKSCQAGYDAKAYTTTWLQSNRVYLDVDDISKTDNYGRYVCVVYLADPDGSLNTSLNFNRQLVDADQACIWNFYNNEFDPAAWWGGVIPDWACVKDSYTTTTSPTWTSPSFLDSSVSKSSSSGGTYVGSTKSDKYHYPNCRWAEKIKPSNEIWFSSSQDARSQGYVACKVCSPP